MLSWKINWSTCSNLSREHQHTFLCKGRLKEYTYFIFFYVELLPMHLHEELDKRWFLKDVTDPKVFDIFDAGGKTFYLGVDPTADSLHLGNFVQFMHAVQYMKRGNTFILIVGGATGMIGDPGGKDAERQFLDEETLNHNVEAIQNQVHTILQNLTTLSWADFSFRVINNLDFYRDMSYLQFLRDVGKHITVNQMITKETVKRRIEDPDKSISYTEFSYMLMQGYDFYTLFKDHHCILQIAWSDQRGNVVTWLELIKKKLNAESYGATCNLILDSTGKKFGKSEGNALRLDPSKTSPFEIYQYFINSSDEDVEKRLKLFTLLSFDQIETIVKEHAIDPSARKGQQQLAYYVTQTIFGKQAADQAHLVTTVLFGTQDPVTLFKGLTPEEVSTLHQATGATTLSSPKLTDLLQEAGLASSWGEAKKAIQSGGISLNEQVITDIGYHIQETDFLAHDAFLLRKGKKTYKIIRK